MKGATSLAKTVHTQIFKVLRVLQDYACHIEAQTGFNLWNLPERQNIYSKFQVNGICYNTVLQYRAEYSAFTVLSTKYINQLYTLTLSPELYYTIIHKSIGQ